MSRLYVPDARRQRANLKAYDFMMISSHPRTCVVLASPVTTVGPGIRRVHVTGAHRYAVTFYKVTRLLRPTYRHYFWTTTASRAAEGYDHVHWRTLGKY